MATVDLTIRKVGVIGAGAMGAGIAAQVANAGVPALLLDIASPGIDRSSVARNAVARMPTSTPAPLVNAAAADLIEVGNVEDDLGRLAGCDWIVEAVVERLENKHDLYRRLEAVCRPGTAVSSNTSTIPLHRLTEGMGKTFERGFFITHFFNPPRFTRLLEVVAGPGTDAATVAMVTDFADEALGKAVVRCNDAPGFAANRVGSYWMQVAMTEALATGVTIEEADAVLGKPFGIPKTGVFGLADLVGLDVVSRINASLAHTLPPGDAFHAVAGNIPAMDRMIAEGRIGRKAGGGFFLFDRKTRTRYASNLDGGEYRPVRAPDLPDLSAADLPTLMEAPTRIGRYAWAVMGKVLAYAASVVPEAAASPHDIDAALRLGYNWRQGPFALIDGLGTAWLSNRLKRSGMAIPPMLEVASGRPFYRHERGRRQVLDPGGTYRDTPRPPGVLLLSEVRAASEPLLRNDAASLWDIGDGVACFEFTSKASALSMATMDLLGEAIVLVQARFKALVIYSDGASFSAGADLKAVLGSAEAGAWNEIEALITAGQRTVTALRLAPFPSVAAVAGMALGGGCEVVLHASAAQAHADCTIGLVECGIGLVPAWGGCTEMLSRWQAAGTLPGGPVPAAVQVFEIVGAATVAKSAVQAKELLLLRASDGITMNRDRLLADAKARALDLVEGYAAARPRELRLPGQAGALTMRAAAEASRRRGVLGEHDLAVANVLAGVLSGGDADPPAVAAEASVLGLERAGFMELVRTKGTLDRIRSTLESRKPVGN